METEPLPHQQGYAFYSVALLVLVALTPTLFGAIALVLLLLLCSALVSGSEVAFFSLTLNDFEKLEQENSQAGQRIIALKNKPRYLLATILIANNLVNIAIVIVSDAILRQLLPEDLINDWAATLLQLFALEEYFQAASTANAINFLITVIGVTFLLVLFGEVAPKVYANLNNIKLAKFMSGPLNILLNAFGPLSTVLVQWSNGIERRLAARTQSTGGTSRKDIDEAIELAVQGEQGGRQEINILKRIVKFGDVSVKQIMRSRVDVIAVDFRTSYRELLRIVKDSGYSRIPVYDNDFDNVTGILYVKDLIGNLNEADHFEWQELIRTDVMYIPEAKKIDDLLKEFQAQRMHMAIVVDEYGGSSGIVTLEDILEEIIGDIKDEFDDELEVEYQKIDNFNYIFEGKTLLNDVCRVIGVDTNTFDGVRGDADSLAGLVLEMTGQLPKAESFIEYNGFRFKMVAVSRRRIERIRVTLPKE